MFVFARGTTVGRGNVFAGRYVNQVFVLYRIRLPSWLVSILK